MSEIGIDDKEFELLKMVLAAHPDWEPQAVHGFLDALLKPYRPKPMTPEDEKMRWPLEALDASPHFTRRLKNVLLAEGCKTVGDVVQLSEHEWLRTTPNMSRRSLNSLKECLAGFGLTLGGQR